MCESFLLPELHSLDSVATMKSIAYRLADSDIVKASAVPADKITHLNHAFARIGKEGTLVSGYPIHDFGAAYSAQGPGNNDESWMKNGGNFGEYLKLKYTHPQLKTLLSVGGWEWSDNFSDMAWDSHTRTKFCRSAAAFIARFGFDGIDIDWEYPNGGGHEHNSKRPDDVRNFTIFIEELRECLEKQSSYTPGLSFLLSAATGASPEKTLLIDYKRLGQAFDFINVMTYDFMGEWDDYSGHHGCILKPEETGKPVRTWAQASIDASKQAGLRPEQINLGLPFYGRQWRVAAPAGADGMYAVAPRSLQTGLESGISYREISALEPHGTSKDHDDIMASSLFIDWETEKRLYPHKLPDLESINEHKPAGRVISYDSPRCLAQKVQWARSQGLGGIMFWELGADREGILVKTLHKALTS